MVAITRKPAGPKAKVKSQTFILDCSKPVEDKIMDIASFEKFLLDKVKVDGKTGEQSELDVSSCAASSSRQRLRDVVGRENLNAAVSRNGNGSSGSSSGNSNASAAVAVAGTSYLAAQMLDSSNSRQHTGSGGGVAPVILTGRAVVNIIRRPCARSRACRHCSSLSNKSQSALVCN